MFTRKMLMWVAASTLSAASIPAIGATVTHRAKHHTAKPAAVTHHVAVKNTAKHGKSTLLASHKGKQLKSTKLTHAKTAKAASTHGTTGVLAMHSGHATQTKLISHKAPAAKKFTTHLLAASTKVKTHN